jgi:uncharacterized protein (DUF1778 family)
MKKQDRVEFRTSHQEREQIEKAASLLGMNVSAYLRMIAIERSIQVLKSSRTIVLSDEDATLFLKALENRPAPNKNLKKAFKQYRSLQKKQC